MVITEDFSHYPIRPDARPRQKTLAITSNDIIRSYRLPDTPNRWQTVLYVLSELKRRVAAGEVRNRYQELLSVLLELEAPDFSLHYLPEPVLKPSDTLPSQSLLDPNNWLYLAHTLFRDQSRFPTVLSKYPQVSISQILKSVHYFSLLFSDDPIDDSEFEQQPDLTDHTTLRAYKKLDMAMHAALGENMREVHIHGDQSLEGFISGYKHEHQLSLFPTKDEVCEYLMLFALQLISCPEVFPFEEFAQRCSDSEDVSILQEVFRLADYWAMVATTPSHPHFISPGSTTLNYSTTFLYQVGHLGFSTPFSPDSITVHSYSNDSLLETTVWHASIPKRKRSANTQETAQFGQDVLRFFATALLSPTSHEIVDPKGYRSRTFIHNRREPDPLSDPRYQVNVRRYDWVSGNGMVEQTTALSPDQAQKFHAVFDPLMYCVHALHAFRFDEQAFYLNVWKPIAGF